MIKMQQLEELENKVVKALRLIEELRSENAKLEEENEALRGIAEEANLAVEEKDQEVLKTKNELKTLNREIKSVKSNEDALEQKVVMLLSKLETVPKQEASKSLEKTIKSKAASTKKATKKKSQTDNLSKEDKLNSEIEQNDENIQENYLMLDDENANLNSGEIILEDEESFIIIDDK